jgi:arylsulfatase A-like enzyme
VPYFHALPASERALPKALRQGGYQTWHVGKWHLGEGQTKPENHGFDLNIGGCGWGHPKHGYFSPYRCPALEDGPEGEYLTDRLTDEVIQLIESRDADRPFFLNLCHYAVHTPIQAPEPLIEKYREKAKRLGLDQKDPMVQGEYYPCQHKRHMRVERRQFQSDPVYAAMIENLDTNLGRLFDALDNAGIADDTLVLFTSDNGGLSTAEGSPTCNAPMAQGKGWMHEGGHRVCQIARWPSRIKPGRVCSEPVTSPDVYPTFLEAAGLPLDFEQHADGLSMMPLLEGSAEQLDREAIYWHYPHYSNQGGTPSCAIRSRRYKLIEHFEDDIPAMMFDLEADVSESHDIADQEPDRFETLAGMLKQWRDQLEVLIPKPNPNYLPPGPGDDPPEV